MGHRPMGRAQGLRRAWGAPGLLGAQGAPAAVGNDENIGGGEVGMEGLRFGGPQSCHD